MKERNLIIIIVGIILVGLLLFSGMTNFKFNIHDNNQPTDSHDNMNYSSGENNYNTRSSNEQPSESNSKEVSQNTPSVSSNTNNT